jgi:chitinase
MTTTMRIVPAVLLCLAFWMAWTSIGNIPDPSETETFFVRYWDSAASAPYLYNPATRMFVSYEDPESIAAKCQYVLKQDLGGIMFWDYLSDTADHALLNSINRGLTSEPGGKD